MTYKKRKSTELAFNSFRKFYPDAPVHIFTDLGGNNYSDLCKRKDRSILFISFRMKCDGHFAGDIRRTAIEKFSQFRCGRSFRSACLRKPWPGRNEVTLSAAVSENKAELRNYFNFLMNDC
jgi:hypothetical protein